MRREELAGREDVFERDRTARHARRLSRRSGADPPRCGSAFSIRSGSPSFLPWGPARWLRAAQAHTPTITATETVRDIDGSASFSTGGASEPFRSSLSGFRGRCRGAPAQNGRGGDAHDRFPAGEQGNLLRKPRSAPHSTRADRPRQEAAGRHRQCPRPGIFTRPRVRVQSQQQQVRVRRADGHGNGPGHTKRRESPVPGYLKRGVQPRRGAAGLCG